VQDVALVSSLTQFVKGAPPPNAIHIQVVTRAVGTLGREIGRPLRNAACSHTPRGNTLECLRKFRSFSWPLCPCYCLALLWLNWPIATPRLRRFPCCSWAAASSAWQTWVAGTSPTNKS